MAVPTSELQMCDSSDSSPPRKSPSHTQWFSQHSELAYVTAIVHAPAGSPRLLTFLLFISAALLNPQPHRNHFPDLSSYRLQAQRKEVVLRARY